MSDVNFEYLEKALRSLEVALAKTPANDLERDGIIQRFEYTFELTWKTAKRVLETNGITSLSPKSVIRDLAQQQWITNPELWIEFLKARNLTTHIYNEKIAKDVINKTTSFHRECKKLLAELMKHS